MRSTRMIVSEGALYRNAAAIRAAIPRDKKLMCVVKADAYGHGSVNAARAMLRAGADAFAVAIVEEAEVLRAAGVAAPILILGGAADESLAQAVRADAAQAVYDAHTLDTLQRAAAEHGKTALAHLKIDSGMTRIGVRCADDLRALLAHWRKNCPDVRNTKIVDIYTTLQEYTNNVTVYDPWANADVVKHEYGIDITTELPIEKFDAVIMGVAHKQFLSLDVKSLVKEGGVIYDVKGLLPRDIVDGRL